jgi:hypothetical protein
MLNNIINLNYSLYIKFMILQNNYLNLIFLLLYIFYQLTIIEIVFIFIQTHNRESSFVN